MDELFVRYFHFVGIIVLSAVLFAEGLLISHEMEIAQFKKLFVIDTILGLSAFVILVAGLLLWLVVGKPSAFYSDNWIFHTKLTLFAIISILSIFPTVFIARQRKSPATRTHVPRYIINIIRLELVLLLCMPLLAVTMARGLSY